MHREVSQRERAQMGSRNRLKLGLFGANCSSGRAVTMVPERWSGSWPDCLALARMADEFGIEFMLPIGRWKGYGGDSGYQGATFETVTWAAGLLAATRHLTVFGTVHAPLIPPLIAAKEFVTADHIGEGRFGLNVVCGWNEGAARRQWQSVRARLSWLQTRNCMQPGSAVSNFWRCGMLCPGSKSGERLATARR
jgi:FMNH2-dependent dimethyl sulfone monooxygenase